MRTMKTLSVVALLGFAGLAYGGPITYTESATLSGSLDGIGFQNAVATLTLIGDTSNIHNDGNFRNPGTASITIEGFAPADFTDLIEVFVNQGAQAAGFDDITLGQASILDTLDAAFGSYDLSTAIGPITNTPFFRPDLVYGTYSGDLIITDTSNSTFSAVTDTAVPEPMTFSFLGLGLAAMGVGARIRRRRSA